MARFVFVPQLHQDSEDEDGASNTRRPTIPVSLACCLVNNSEEEEDGRGRGQEQLCMIPCVPISVALVFSARPPLTRSCVTNIKVKTRARPVLHVHITALATLDASGFLTLTRRLTAKRLNQLRQWRPIGDIDQEKSKFDKGQKKTDKEAQQQGSRRSWKHLHIACPREYDFIMFSHGDRPDTLLLCFLRCCISPC